MQKRIAAQTAGGIALGYPKRRRRGVRSRIAGVFSSFGWFSEYSKRGRGAVLFGLARRIGTGMDGGGIRAGRLGAIRARLRDSRLRGNDGGEGRNG